MCDCKKIDESQRLTASLTFNEATDMNTTLFQLKRLTQVAWGHGMTSLLFTLVLVASLNIF